MMKKLLVLVELLVEKNLVLIRNKKYILGSAYFDPIHIARTGRKLNINSDARYRFERGTDPNFVLEGLDIATKMILDIWVEKPVRLVLLI